MPQVTRIGAQVKRRGRYSIYVDGRYRFSLSELQISTSGLREGLEISEEEIAQWQQRSDEGKALDRSYNYLSYRARSKKEVTDYLARKQYAPEVGERIIAQLEAQNLINDNQFAESWLENRQQTSPRSRRRLQQELRAKGVDSDTISQTLAGVSDEDEVATIQRLIESKRLVQRYNGDTQKLTAYLAGQGFSYGLIKRALEDD